MMGEGGYWINQLGEHVFSGRASPGAQVKYLSKLLTLKQNEIESLELELQGEKLSTQVKLRELEGEVRALQSVSRRNLNNIFVPIKKRPWWAFWRKRASRN